MEKVKNRNLLYIVPVFIISAAVLIFISSFICYSLNNPINYTRLLSAVSLSLSVMITNFFIGKWDYSVLFSIAFSTIVLLLIFLIQLSCGFDTFKIIIISTIIPFGLIGYLIGAKKTNKRKKRKHAR